MLRKVLKYDFAFLAKKWWILAAALFVGAFPGALLLRALLSDGGESEIATAMLSIAAMLYLFVYAVMMVGSLLFTAVMLYWRFYTHFYSDEGYLTFTLPVKRSTLLRAKVINEAIWYAFNALLILLCLCVFFWIAPPPTAEYPVFNPTVYKEIGRIFSLARIFFLEWSVLFWVEAVLVLAAWMLFSTCLVQYCITVGAVIAKKHKLLLGVGIFYGVNALLSTVGRLLFSLGGLSVVGAISYLLEGGEQGQTVALILLLMLLLTVFFLALAALAHCLTQDQLDRGLNLA